MVTGDSQNIGRITEGEVGEVGSQRSEGQGGGLPDGASTPGNARNADRVLPRNNQQGVAKLTHGCNTKKKAYSY